MAEIYTASAEGKTQADGAFELELGAADEYHFHQIQVEVSATPAAGTLTVRARTPGAAAFQDIEDGEIDLTGTLQPLELQGRVEALEFSPSGFDAGKTYSVYVASGR